MARCLPALHDVVARLRERYGAPEPPPVTDPWEQIVLINASYLMSDARQVEVLEELRSRVGLAPEALLAADEATLLEAIARGGMKPEMRRDKLLAAAGEAAGLEAPLGEIVRGPLDAAARVLVRFPGIGKPVAERVALVAGAHAVLALESNGLRVLVRLGFGEEHERYDKTWRSAREDVDREAPRDVPGCLEAHLLLRRHGRETCKHKGPRCDDCPLVSVCAFAARAGAADPAS